MSESFTPERVVEVDDGQTVVAYLTWQQPTTQDTHSLAIVWRADLGGPAHPRVYRGSAADVWVPQKYDSGESLPRTRKKETLSKWWLKLGQRSRQLRNGSVHSYFSAIEIEGLRGFGKTERLELAQPSGADGSGLTILVGANNSGKSSVIEAFDAVFRATRQSSVSFAADRRHAGANQSVQISLTRADGRAVGVGSLRAGTSEARVIWDHTEAQHPGFKVDLTAIPARRQFSAYFGRHGDGDRGWASTSGEYSRSQNRDGFVGRLFALHADERRLAAFNELLREVTGRALSWSIDLGAQQQYFLRFTDSDGGSHTSDGLGDGLISLLFILDALHDSTVESLIVIDEPELSLHPQFVLRLGKVLARYAADRQIVFATHSPSLVDWTWIAAGARIARIYKRAGRSRVAQPLATTIQSIADAHLTNTHNPHVFGPVGNEVFFQEDGLLVLEGQEDVIYLPIVLREVQAELNAEVFGWGAGGASRAQAVLQLFSELHFQNVAVLLDGDEATQKIAAELRANYPSYHVETHPADDIRTKSRRNAQPEKQGLLQADNRALRPEHVDQTRDLFARINDYFTRESA